MAAIELRGLTKRFGEVTAVDGVDLEVRSGEFLTLLEALRQRVGGHSIDEFYYLSRACLVKDESLYDRYDKAFGEYFKGVESLPGLEAAIPEDWLRALVKKHFIGDSNSNRVMVRSFKRGSTIYFSYAEPRGDGKNGTAVARGVRAARRGAAGNVDRDVRNVVRRRPPHDARRCNRRPVACERPADNSHVDRVAAGRSTGAH